MNIDNDNGAVVKVHVTKSEVMSSMPIAVHPASEMINRTDSVWLKMEVVEFELL